MASCIDVAKLANVSRQTVSRVINGSKNVSPETKKIVLDAIKRLNYYPNIAARTLKSTKSKCLGFIIPDPDNSFYINIASLLQKKLSQKGYNLLIMFSHEDAALEQRCIHSLIEQRVELILFVPIGFNDNLLTLLNIHNIRCIQLFRNLYSGIDSISINDEHGSYMATDYLLKHNNNRILLLEDRYPFESTRLIGMKKAYQDNKLTYEDNFYLSIAKNTDLSIIAKTIKTNNISAVIAVGKYIEFILLKELTNNKSLSTHKIKIVFYDDNDIAKLLNIPVITHNLNSIVSEICTIILRKIQFPESHNTIIINPILDDRSSIN